MNKCVGLVQWMFFVGVMCLLSGCGALKESSKWRKEFGDFRTNMVKAVDTLAESIPGERDARIWALVHSSNKAEHEEGIRQLEAKAGIRFDEQHSYECSVWFDVNTKSSIKAQAFALDLPGTKSVKNFIDNFSFNPTPVTSFLLPPPSREEVIARMEKDIDRALELLTGTYKIVDAPPLPRPMGDSGSTRPSPFQKYIDRYESTWPNELLTPSFTSAGNIKTKKTGKEIVKEEMDDRIKERSKARDQLVKAIIGAYESNTTRNLGRAKMVIPWNVFEQKYLVLLVNKADLEANTNHFAVKALLHKKGNTKTTFKNFDEFTLTPAHFLTNEPINTINGKYCWAAANVAQVSHIDPATVNALESTRRFLQMILEADKAEDSR